jgi:phage terminase large subunit
MKTLVQIPSDYKELFNPYWRYQVYYGGRSSGKSHSVARALLLQARKSKLRILCTRELQKSIKDSVHKLLSDLINEYNFTDYEIWKDRIINKITGSEFIFLGVKHNTIEIKSTEGIDRCWVEEAQSITEESLNILTPTIRKEGSQIIFTFNRITELDPVYVKYVMNKPDKCYVCKVNYDVLDKLGWLPDVSRLEIEADRTNKGLFAHKWLGEPLSQQEKSIIDRDMILDAMQREIRDDGQIIIGADIARMGDDRTVFFKRKGLKVIEYKMYNKLRTTQVCDMLEAFSKFDKSVEIKIDDTGVGGGITDEMLKRGYSIVAINFGSKAKDEDKYPNLISEAWFELNEIINQIQLPYNSDLLMELSTRQWKQDSKGKRAVESKNEYKKRGFRSPDIADACIICFYTPKNNSITMDDISL